MECTQCKQEVAELVKVNDSKLCVDCVGSDKYQTLKEFGQVIVSEFVTEKEYKTAMFYIENLTIQVSKLEQEILKYKEVVSKYDKQLCERLIKDIRCSEERFIDYFKLNKSTSEYIDLTPLELIIKENNDWSYSELKKTDWENCSIYKISYYDIEKLGLLGNFDSIRPCKCYPERSEYVDELYAMWNNNDKRWMIYGFSDLWKYPPSEESDGISMVCEELVFL